jgi:hypothetical protein
VDVGTQAALKQHCQQADQTLSHFLRNMISQSLTQANGCTNGASSSNRRARSRDEVRQACARTAASILVAHYLSPKEHEWPRKHDEISRLLDALFQLLDADKDRFGEPNLPQLSSRGDCRAAESSIDRPDAPVA